MSTNRTAYGYVHDALEIAMTFLEDKRMDDKYAASCVVVASIRNRLLAALEEMGKEIDK